MVRITLDELRRFSGDQMPPEDAGWSLDRRQFVKRGVGVLAATTLPLRRVSAGTLLWQPTAGGVVLRDDKIEYWRVDRNSLGRGKRLDYGVGSAGLWLEIESDLRLGSRPLAARVEIEHRRNWQIRLAASYLRQPAVASLEAWLGGSEKLAAPGDVDARIAFPGLGAVGIGRGGIATSPTWALTLAGAGIVRANLAGGLRMEADELIVEAGADADLDGLRLTAHGARVRNARGGFRIGDDTVSFSSSSRVVVVLNQPFTAAAPSAFLRSSDDERTAVQVASRQVRTLKPVRVFHRFVLGVRRSEDGEHRALFGGVGEAGRWFEGDLLAAHVPGPQWAIAAEWSRQTGQHSGAPAGLIVSGCQVVLPGADFAELIPRTSVPLSGCAIDLRNGDSSVPLDQFVLRVRRAVDMLDLRFSFLNVEIRRTKRRLALRTKDESKPSLIRVHFPPQVMGDEVFFVQRDLKGQAASIDPEDLHWKSFPIPTCDAIADKFEREKCRRKFISESVIDQEPPVANGVNEFANRDYLRPRVLPAGRSRLVFATPDGAPLQRAWSLDDLLQWNDLDLRVHPRAAPTGTSWMYQAALATLPLEAPAPDETSIEAPFGVQLSPLADAPCLIDGKVAGPQRTRLTTHMSGGIRDRPAPAVELWHARLEVPKTRAIWARGFKKEAFGNRFGGLGSSQTETEHPAHKAEVLDNKTFRLTFDNRDRHEFVALSSVYGLPAVPGSAGVIKAPDPRSHAFFSPGPIDTDRILALSSVGASFRLRGNWDPPLPIKEGSTYPWQALTVESLRSRHVWGAEDFGRVVYRGFLFPLGVRVSLVKLTERQFEWDPLDKTYKAVKLQRLFIVLPKKVKFYPAVRQPFSGRDFDLTSLEFLIERTPDLIPVDCGVTGLETTPGPYDCSNIDNEGENRPLDHWLQDLFWPQVAPGQFVSFPFVAKDQGNRTTVREGPLLFVSNFLAYRPRVVERIVQYYNTNAPEARRTISVGGQRVGYAPPARTGARRAETAFETSRIVLNAHLTAFDEDSGTTWSNGTLEELQSAAQPPFYPCDDTAHVSVPAIQQMVGTDSPSTRIAYDPVYREHGFSADRNQIEVFARIKDPVPFNVSRNSSNVGGVASPNTEMRALSRTRGLIGGSAAQSSVGGTRAAAGAPANDSIAALQGGRFDPVSMFATSVGDAKLLGTIRLADVIRVALSQLSGVPEFIDEMMFEGLAAVRNLFCDGATPRVIEMLEALRQAVDAVPESPAKRMLRARVDALQATANRVQSACGSTGPTADADVAAGVTEFVRAGQDFVNDARAVQDAPALLLPEAVREAIETVSSALAPFLPPFDPANALRQQFRGFLEAILKDTIDEAAAQLAPALRNLQQEFQPTLLETWRAVSDLRARLLQESAAVEATLVTRFAEASAVAAAHLDELQILQQAIAANACSTAAAAITNAAKEHAGKPLEALCQRLEALWIDLDTHGRALFKLANDPAVPDDVRTRAVAIHERLRVQTEALIAALRRVCELADVQPGDLAILCTAVWNGAVGAEAHQALANVKAGVLQILAPAQAVRAIRPLQDILTATLAELPPAPPAPAAAIAPAGGLAELRLHVQALVTAVAGIAGEAVEILTRRAPGQPLPQAVADRIRATETLVAAVKALSFSARLNQLLDELLTEARDEWNRLVAAAELEALERVSIVEQAICQRIVDALLPGALQGFDQIVTWYNAWQNAANSLIAPARSVVGTLRTAVNTALTSQAGSLLAAPLRTDLENLRRVADAALIVLGQPAVTGTTLKLLADVARRSEALARTTLEHLSRGQVDQLVSLDEVLTRLEELLLSIVPARRAFRYEWATALQPFPAAAGSEVFIPLSGSSEKSLFIKSKVEVSLAPGGVATHTELVGEVRNFKLVLLPGIRLLAVTFVKVSFNTQDGGAPKYDVDLGPVEFLGPFKFVDGLLDDLKQFFDDGGNGPYLRISTNPPVIEAGFRFGTDVISCGAFAFQNVRIALAFRLPLNSQPATFVFAFASREKPFLVSAGIYGGGGFLALTGTPTKLIGVEGSVEFGAVTAIKFGPLNARGRVTAGLYFRIDPSGSALAGFVVAAGSGRIAWLGISVVLRVEVKSDGRNASGSASFEVSFEISSFLTLTFGFTAGYTFKGGGTPQRVLAAQESGGAKGPMHTAANVQGRPRPECGPLPEGDEPICPPKDTMWWPARRRYRTLKGRH
jgi:hypothetical protein